MRFSRGLSLFDAIHFLSRLDQHVLGHPQSAQATVSALRTADGRLVAVRHDDEKVNVAVVMWIAPSVRAVKPDLFGLKFLHESLGGCFNQVLVQRFHVFLLAKFTYERKPGFARGRVHAFA